ncbi:MAG: SGNH/GDSL hydrolase family protein [Desulfobacteraceae bacterium]|nr:SGNH/GDSL hydrolase family protein [Desulfobacteraceae bacterium]
MKKKTILSITLLSITILPFLCLTTAAWALDVDTLVLFGDSLSDTGNLYTLNPSQVPEQYYYQGRFSNGPLWGEYLAATDYLNCDLVNQAYGKATTSGDDPVPGLISQTSAFIDSTAISTNMLFAVWIGGNDFINGSTDYQTSADNIGLAIEDLASAGAQQILIVNLPDLGATPLLFGTAGAPLATNLTKAFNAALAAVIDNFKTNNPDVNVYEFDVFAFLQNIAVNPETYGFTNVTQVCPSFTEINNFNNNDGYLFWDKINPTTEAHKGLADQIISILKE